MNLSLKSGIWLGGLMVCCLVFASRAANYYVNSISGLDANPGTSKSQAWQTLTPVMAKTFQPGDTINFARGSSWSVSKYANLFLIDDNGTANNPIIFRAYGTGALPTFSNTGDKYNQGIKISADYVIVGVNKPERFNI